MSTQTQQIKAVLQPDPASTKLTLTTLPYPTPSASEYIVKVKAAALTKDELGWELADPHLYTSPRDRVPSIEGAGVVVSAPRGAPCEVGTDVFYTIHAGATGTLREFATVDINAAAPKPATLDWASAAATPLSALTAWQGVFVHGPLDAAALTASGPERAAAKEKNAALSVLVTGAGGGVGSWAVKLAHAAGATVVGVARESKAADVRRFGAADVIDYAGVDAYAADETKLVDLVLDTIGGDGMKTLWSAVKDSGLFLAVGPDPPENKPEGKRAEGKWYLFESSAEQLAHVARIIDSEGLGPLVDEVFPLDRFNEAFEKVASGRTKGKVVVTVE